MKSTERFYENLSNGDFRKTKIDLQKAVDHVMKQRIHEKKKEVISKMNTK